MVINPAICSDYHPGIYKPSNYVTNYKKPESVMPSSAREKAIGSNDLFVN